MTAFKLKISGSDVIKPVDTSTLEEYSQKIEGDGLWDYRLDDLSVSLDKTFLDDFDIKTTEVYQLRKLNAQLLYYNEIVFDGVIEGAKYDWKTETVDIDISSWGKILADIPISFIETIPTITTILKYVNVGGYTSLQQVPDTEIIGNKPEQIAEQLLAPISASLVDNSYTTSPYYEISMSIDDFPAYKNLVVNYRHLADIVKGAKVLEDSDFKGIYKRVTESPGSLLSGTTSIGRYYGCWVGRDYLNLKVHLLRLKSDGFPTPDNYFTKTLAEFVDDYEIPEDITDQTILDEITTALGWISNPRYLGLANFDDKSYWLYANSVFVHAEWDDKDLFLYKYENSDVATIQKDIAILTNSLTWVFNNKINFTTRDPSQTLSNKSIIECSCEMIIKNDELPLSDGIQVSETVLTIINDYYNKYMDGTFLKYSILIDRTEFDSNEYPLIAKNLEISLEGKNTPVGIIKEVTYKEDVIEFVTEKKVEE